MEPTVAEIIFWIVALAVCGLTLLVATKGVINPMDITNSKLRDWNNREREWNK